jgi:glutaredoxin 3
MQGEKATLFRMVLPEHTCPFGVRAKELLEDSGYLVDDRVLKSREEVEACKAEHGVATTPVVFLGDRKIGGCDELESFLEDSQVRNTRASGQSGRRAWRCVSCNQPNNRRAMPAIHATTIWP